MSSECRRVPKWTGVCVGPSNHLSGRWKCPFHCSNNHPSEHRHTNLRKIKCQGEIPSSRSSVKALRSKFDNFICSYRTQAAIYSIRVVVRSSTIEDKVVDAPTLYEMQRCWARWLFILPPSPQLQLEYLLLPASTSYLSPIWVLTWCNPRVENMIKHDIYIILSSTAIQVNYYWCRHFPFLVDPKVRRIIYSTISAITIDADVWMFINVLTSSWCISMILLLLLLCLQWDWVIFLSIINNARVYLQQWC